MFDVFGSVKGLLKLESICIDNNVFRLHYKATAIILIVASLLVTSRQYIGDPIDCIVEEIPNNVRKTSRGNQAVLRNNSRSKENVPVTEFTPQKYISEITLYRKKILTYLKIGRIYFQLL